MTLRANLRNAEQLLANLEADLQFTKRATALEILDLYYLRWMVQRVIHRLRARARQYSGATRRDLTTCQDRYGNRNRKLGA